MASKNYVLMLGLISLLSSASYAQTDTAGNATKTDTTQNAGAATGTDTTGAGAGVGTGTGTGTGVGTSAGVGAAAGAETYTPTTGDAGYDWRDSSKIPTRRLPQQSEFVNNQYPYPAKPRSMWELGFSAGNSMIFGDIKSKADVGGGITLRHAISHTFSYRIGYFGSYNQGYGSGYQLLTGKRPYQNWTHMGGLDLIASLNPNSHYRGNPKTNIYVLAGYSLVAAKVFQRGTGTTQIDGAYGTYYGAGQPNNRSGLFPGINTFGGKKVGERKGWSLLNAASVGAGVAVKLSKKINIGIEQRFTGGSYDALDGYIGGKSNDIYSFTSARLNINLGSSSKRVEPLWWLNGNNFIYNELNRPQHMKIPTPVLPDADGDGVTDQFDMEPNTPAGAPVDVRGVAKDSDGDGVPDYKDKELLTPQKCFPVDADGVGNCPEPACCTELRTRMDSLSAATSCTLTNLPSVQFRSGRATLSKDAMGLLQSAAEQIKGSPNCRIKVIGHLGTGQSSKRAQQLSWDRVNTVIRYLVEKQGISEDRLIFSYQEEGEGDPNTVDLQGTTETGPSTVPAPHPNLQKRK
ncbi:OmpA family protein [Segetibacter koreensis]|uniref:OmpA family protein n=1 Tax=Segetibacter koreensis TaxID=398037 RepID=UPI0012F8209A|nr:OmpA family protein [Segetibacter koreensis]